MTTLLQFTLARLASRLTFLSATRYSQRRLLHTHLPHNPPIPTFTYGPCQSSNFIHAKKKFRRSEQNVVLSRLTKQHVGPLSDLEKRVQELEEAAEKEVLIHSFFLSFLPVLVHPSNPHPLEFGS
jgi:hypothetical protein